MAQLPTWRLACVIEVEAEDADWAEERLRRALAEAAGMALRRAALADPATTEEAYARSPLLAAARQILREREAPERETRGPGADPPGVDRSAPDGGGS